MKLWIDECLSPTLFETGLDYIERIAGNAGEWMLNKRVVVAPSGQARHDDLEAA